jgi:hypothetical protein
MRTSLASAGAVVAAGALAALAATSIADGGAPAQPPASDPDIDRVAVERVAPSVANRQADRSPDRRGEQALRYFEVPTPLEVPPNTEVAVELSKCPRGSKAVTAYFQPERPGTFLDRSRPDLGTSRMWTIGAFNHTDTADQVTFGLVCLSRVK